MRWDIQCTCSRYKPTPNPGEPTIYLSCRLTYMVAVKQGIITLHRARKRTGTAVVAAVAPAPSIACGACQVLFVALKDV